MILMNKYSRLIPLVFVGIGGGGASHAIVTLVTSGRHPEVEIGIALAIFSYFYIWVQLKIWQHLERRRRRVELLNAISRQSFEDMNPEEIEQVQLAMLDGTFPPQEVMEVVRMLTNVPRTEENTNITCLYYNDQKTSQFLHCAVNPTGSCQKCTYFKAKG